MSSKNNLQYEQVAFSLNDQSTYPKALVVGLYMLVPLILWAIGMMIYINSSAKTTTNTVSSITVDEVSFPEATLQFVGQRLRRQFTMGDWRYDNLVPDNGVIQAYIQILQKLDFDKSQQTNYIRQSLCPGGADDIWSKLSPKQLEIHLYTRLKSNSVYTSCS
jgi:hypothetical protein